MPLASSLPLVPVSGSRYQLPALPSHVPLTIVKEVLDPLKRNTIVLGVTLLLLAVFAWAGWANWEYRKQAAQNRADAATLKAELAVRRQS